MSLKFGNHGSATTNKKFMNQNFLSGLINKILIVILCVIPLVLSLVLYPDFLGDDTYIHIGFILGLLQGNGFAFAGNVTYGTTSPLWVLLGSFLSILTDDPESSLRFLSGLFTALSVFFFLLISDTLKLRSSIKFVAALSFCLNPFFLRWALSGMESTAAVALLLFLIYAYYDRYHVRHPYIQGILLGCAVLLRPEFLVFTLIFFAYQLFVNKHHKKQTLKSVVTGVSIIGAWLLFAFSHFGTIVPNTFKAKAPGGFFNMTIEGTLRNLKLLLGGNIPEFILIAIIVVVVFFLTRKRDEIFSEDLIRLLDRFRHTGLLLALIFFVSFYVYYTVKDVTIISRYSLMFIPIIILLVASMINLLLRFKSEINISLIAVYSVLIILIHIHITFSIVKPATDLFVKGFQNSYKEISNFIKLDNNSDHKMVALNDVGIVGVYSGARVVDLAGLVDAERFKYTTVSDFLLSKKPDYLVLREEIELHNAVPESVSVQILYKKEIPGFGINNLENRTVTLYKLNWDTIE